MIFEKFKQMYYFFQKTETRQNDKKRKSLLSKFEAVSSTTDLICISMDHPGTADLMTIFIMAWVVGIAEGTSRASKVTSTLWNKRTVHITSRT